MDKTIRQEKVNSLMRNIISSFISSEVSSKALVTVTKVDISSDLRTAKIFVSIFPEDKEKQTMIILKRKLSDLRDYVKVNIKMKILPIFSFEIDQGIKLERKIEELL